jgi:hypothetical protein
MRQRKLVINVPVNVRGGSRPTTVNVGDIIIDRDVLNGASPLRPSDRVRCCGVWRDPLSLEMHCASRNHKIGRLR